MVTHSLVFDTAWFGDSPKETCGKDNTPGATRTFVGPTAVGTYTFIEKVGRPRETRVTIILTNAVSVCRLYPTRKINAALFLCFSSRETVGRHCAMQSQ